MAKFNTVLKRIEELSHPDVEVRRRAARKLGEKGDARAVQPLCLALRDEDAHVRRGAATALGMLHAPDSLQPLQEALKDKREGLRGAAAWAVGQIGKHHPAMASRAVALIVETAQKDKPRELSRYMMALTALQKDGQREFNRYVTALTAMELAAVSPLCVEFSSRRSKASQQCAEATLITLLYHSNLDVTRHLLADKALAPVQIWDALEMLEAHRPAGFFASRRFPTAQRLCELAAANPNEPTEVQQGAKRVLEYLSLGRASQFHDPTASASLLRMASSDPSDDNGETLLRGSESNGTSGLYPARPVGKLAHIWRSILAKLQSRFRFR